MVVSTVLRYVHGTVGTVRDGEPRTATLTFTQLLSSGSGQLQSISPITSKVALGTFGQCCTQAGNVTTVAVPFLSSALPTPSFHCEEGEEESSVQRVHSLLKGDASDVIKKERNTHTRTHARTHTCTHARTHTV